MWCIRYIFYYLLFSGSRHLVPVGTNLRGGTGKGQTGGPSLPSAQDYRAGVEQFQSAEEGDFGAHRGYPTPTAAASPGQKPEQYSRRHGRRAQGSGNRRGGGRADLKTLGYRQRNV